MLVDWNRNIENYETFLCHVEWKKNWMWMFEIFTFEFTKVDPQSHKSTTHLLCLFIYIVDENENNWTNTSTFFAKWQLSYIFNHLNFCQRTQCRSVRFFHTYFTIACEYKVQDDKNGHIIIRKEHLCLSHGQIKLNTCMPYRNGS